ncbi:MAG: BrnT family toxin [Acidobacteriota bacterium]
MTKGEGPRFDWDEANAGHIARHGITPAEAEEVLAGSVIPIESGERGGEERYTELGETARGRLLVVAWTWRGEKVRVVTAFPANRKWRGLYRRLKKGGDNG